MVEDNSSIRTAGKSINCLYVSKLQRNLISVSHVCQDMQGFFAFFENHCVFVQHTTGQILCDYPLSDGLYSTMDLLDIDPPTGITQQRANDIYTYLAGTVEEACHVQEEVMHDDQRA
jgi:hypothetical protein